MSGHSKWSTIKRAKGAADAKRGALFTKLARDIVLAVRDGGGGDPDMNFRLRLAIDKAKSNNMPQDNIVRSIKRATGEGGEGKEEFEEIIYEGYGPGGGAILLQAFTTNRNRTASDVRSAFNKIGGSLGESGCVSWNFEKKGVITVETGDSDKADELSLLAIEAEADDVKYEDGVLEIFSTPEKLQGIQEVMDQNSVDVSSSDISLVPKTTIALDAKSSEQTLRLLDNLEELMDVQKAYTNADFPPEVLEQYQAAE
ncbi:MAG: YebC/PmpR family DNA-binding transcriptional regulator [Dehalococcoidia bacterium]|nr:YebC/PmpR family DNA-binding transcriptional regulator [Dehalococcoidia bacterium]|tara:strand:+ start:13335 stop:14102 length:768 start_codon:yes stop_codon:yes gene_type:complete